MQKMTIGKLLSAGHPVGANVFQWSNPKRIELLETSDMNETASPERLLRAREVIQRIGVSRSTFFAMIREGKFPAGVKITDQCVGWREAVVDAWIRDRPTAAAGSEAA